MAHYTNIAILGRTRKSIDSRRALHRMVFRARRLPNIVPFLRYTTPVRTPEVEFTGSISLRNFLLSEMVDQGWPERLHASELLSNEW